MKGDITSHADYEEFQVGKRHVFEVHLDGRVAVLGFCETSPRGPASPETRESPPPSTARGLCSSPARTDGRQSPRTCSVEAPLQLVDPSGGSSTKSRGPKPSRPAYRSGSLDWLELV